VQPKTPTPHETFDTIIVGAGTAGCLLANRLSRDPARRVLLLEAGKRDTYPWIHIPVGYLYCIGNPRTDWLYRTEPEPALSGRSIRYPRGRGLGGCGALSPTVMVTVEYDVWLANPETGAASIWFAFSSAVINGSSSVPTITAVPLTPSAPATIFGAWPLNAVRSCASSARW